MTSKASIRKVSLARGRGAALKRSHAAEANGGGEPTVVYFDDIRLVRDLLGDYDANLAVLEDRLRAHHLVGQCLVVGDGRPFVAALVTLDPEAYAVWSARRGGRGDLARAPEDAEVRAELQAAVDETNRSVSPAESIRRFEVLGVDWTEEGGHLTPSLKLRRNVVMRDFRHEVERLYES